MDTDTPGRTWSRTMGCRSKRGRIANRSQVFETTVANPFGPTTLARAGLRVGYEIEEGVKSTKDIK